MTKHTSAHTMGTVPLSRPPLALVAALLLVLPGCKDGIVDDPIASYYATYNLDMEEHLLPAVLDR